VLFGLLACCVAAGSRAATLVAGLVTDAVTSAPISGAKLQVEKAGVSIGSATSDGAGQFRVTIEIPNQPAAQNLKLTVQLENYRPTDSDVIIKSSRTDRASYRIALVPNAVADCQRQRLHTVVVGHFRSPAGAPALLELASRIKEKLAYDVGAKFQKDIFVKESLPLFLACEQIIPQDEVDYANFAKVLKADAFLAGSVAPAGVGGSQKVKVTMSIADQFGLLSPPTRATSPNIDLDNPEASSLQAAAQTAIFTALIAGYERSRNFSECVRAVSVAQEAIGTLPPDLIEARKRCQRATPNIGLVRDSP
jgi:hypothetical protein